MPCDAPCLWGVAGRGAAFHVMYIDLFRTFFKIGLFTLGGGYAMIPLIEKDVVERNKWIGQSEFLDILAVSQSCPGALAVNISVFVGYRMRKMRGALCTVLGAVLPSFVIILFIAMFFHQFQDNAVVASMFRGIRPAVVALIAAPTFSLAKSARISLVNCWIPVVSALLIWLMGVNPVYILLVAAVGGYLYGLLVKPTE